MWLLSDEVNGDNVRFLEVEEVVIDDVSCLCEDDGVALVILCS